MSRPVNGSAFTLYGWSVCFWAILNAFQYGYHISVLNQIQAVLSCKLVSPNLAHAPRLSSCIPMSDLTFSLVTAIFTVGGLAGSLLANSFIDSWGRRGTHRFCAILVALGAALMGLSSNIYFLLLGRVIIGLGNGLSLCVGPIFLAEIAPSSISGSIGVLTQLAIVFGIMLTQFIGINLATPALWRFVFFISFCLAVLQAFSASVVVESPAFLLKQGRLEDHKHAAYRLWGTSIPSLASEESLLNEDFEELRAASPDNVTISQVFTSKELRKPLLIVCYGMLAQQVSGINAVLYYSNDILAKSLPEFGPYVSLGVTVINVIMTFPPIILIERMGRRPLLLLSTLGGMASVVALGYGLDSGAPTFSSLAIITFVMSFATGLGPIPFVMIPEVSPPYAVSALSSVALSLNWIVNFIVGFSFLPLRNVLAGGDRFKEGRIFYLFVFLLGFSAFLLFRVYRP
ncbi:unnamed protein product [Cyclocybe aegerita]|uniref:Major facilitator superfamily (MFS) profile domain-containing protein n=1 Tax=Cyclocybe aegerita TaxID=1973307 RepID=A0A8S0W0F8_CYCAE|nr:unnamed protein product [Cyclocybe aegerita]